MVQGVVWAAGAVPPPLAAIPLFADAVPVAGLAVPEFVVPDAPAEGVPPPVRAVAVPPAVAPPEVGAVVDDPVAVLRKMRDRIFNEAQAKVDRLDDAIRALHAIARLASVAGDIVLHKDGTYEFDIVRTQRILGTVKDGPVR